ncbi:polysaccharide deacetylase family protein [Halomicroarcula limicola]|uniref:Polysaccharide deacetylase family protein n=1 Tax=Haloarcula limicola TaxID=1429915 RepID=A0A8J7Y2S4_9EURY|nr:polysaccharide deacetylase family protein [Halomicroarcula limicola]MBV0923117.1 polysaccharide deacetylase family protein [Halomicroarcula limicola]
MYHSVHPGAEKEWGPWQYAVTPETFERQLAYITTEYDVSSLSDLLESCLAGSPPAEPTAVITFDDGYRDNLTEALPLLERYEAPATVFVAGKYLDGMSPYEYRLAAKLQSATGVAVSIGGETVDQPLTDDESRHDAYERLRATLKFERSDVRDAVIARIDGTTTAAPAMLSGNELRRLDTHRLIEIGAHGYEHVPLTSLDEDALTSDVLRSKTELERYLDRDIEQFSYPYGACSEAVAEAVERAGFRSAVTTVPRRISAAAVSGSRFRIPRLDGATVSVPRY